MDQLAFILAATGLMTMLVGSIWFLVVAFKENILWGLGCLLIPVVSFVFLIMYWRDTAKPFGLEILGLIMIVLARFAIKATPV